MPTANSPNASTTTRPTKFRTSMLDLSIESANQLYGWSNIALIFGAVAVLAGTIGVIWASAIRERYADHRISQNETDTALAQSVAAKAN